MTKLGQQQHQLRYDLTELVPFLRKALREEGLHLWSHWAELTRYVFAMPRFRTNYYDAAKFTNWLSKQSAKLEPLVLGVVQRENQREEATAAAAARAAPPPDLEVTPSGYRLEDEPLATYLLQLLREGVCVWGHWTSLAAALQQAHYSRVDADPQLMQHMLFKYLDNHHARLATALEEKGFHVQSPVELLLPVLSSVLEQQPNLWGHWEDLARQLYVTDRLPAALDQHSIFCLLQNYHADFQQHLEYGAPHGASSVGAGQGGGSGSGTGGGVSDDERDFPLLHPPLALATLQDRVFQGTIDLMALDLQPGEYRSTSEPWDDAADEAAAQLFRDKLRENCRLPERVCCVCAIRCTAREMFAGSPLPYSSLAAELEQLRVDTPASPEVPRKGNTHWTHYGTTYHLLPQAIQPPPPGSDDPLLAICSACYSALTSNCQDLEKRVPRLALARCDIGPMPDWYEGFTMVEQMLLAPMRMIRSVVVLSNPSLWRPVSQSHHALHGHCISFPNPGLAALARALPLRLDDLPELIRVNLVGVAPTVEAARAQAEAMAARGWPPLTVDGRKVARYVAHLSVLMSTEPELWAGVQVNTDALEEIARFSAQPRIPPQILASLTNVPPGEFTIKVMQALHSDPESYARTSFDTPPPYTQTQLGMEPPTHDAPVGLGEACLEVTEEHQHRQQARQQRAAAEAAAAVAAADAAVALTEGRSLPATSATSATTDSHSHTGPADTSGSGAAGAATGEDTSTAAAAAAATYVDRAARGVELEKRMEALLAATVQPNPEEEVGQDEPADATADEALLLAAARPREEDQEPNAAHHRRVHRPSKPAESSTGYGAQSPHPSTSGIVVAYVSEYYR